MIAIETVRHRLALAVRVDDHFTQEPLPREVGIELDSGEPPLRSVDHTGVRHADGTYRFLAPVVPGVRQLRVTVPDAFTWTPTTAVTLPLADPRIPVVIETWPTANAVVPPGTLAIRGRLVATPPAAIGQQVTMEVAGIGVPRNRRTRCDAGREFLFVVLGPMELDANQQVPIDVTVTGRTIASIDVFDGGAVTTFSTATIAVPPGREARVLIHLS